VREEHLPAGSRDFRLILFERERGDLSDGRGDRIGKYFAFFIRGEATFYL